MGRQRRPTLAQRPAGLEVVGVPGDGMRGHRIRSRSISFIGTMARVEKSDTTLTVYVTGWDWLWSFKSQLEIPLAHIKHAAVDPEIACRWWKGWRMPGTRVPGTRVPGGIAAGTFYKDGECV